MSKCSVSLDTLTSEFPEHELALRQLADVLQQKGQQEGFCLSINRIYDLIEPHSITTLARILGSLVDKGVLKQFVRVNSSSGGGIGDFESIVDVPMEIFDARRGCNVEVNLDQIELLYKAGRIEIHG